MKKIKKIMKKKIVKLVIAEIAIIKMKSKIFNKKVKIINKKKKFIKNNKKNHRKKKRKQVKV